MTNVVQRNILRTYVCMALLTLLITLLGYIISSTFNFGLSGTGIFLTISGIINFIAYFYSDKLIIKSSNVKPLAQEDIPELFNIVGKICNENNMPLPKLYYLNNDAINAFATGRDQKHAAIVVTKGLLEKLTPNEIKGVLGHELSHVKNFDTRLMAVITILVGLVSILADIYWRSQVVSKVSQKDRSGVLSIIGLVLALFAPISAMFIQMAVSRKREYIADALGAQMVKSSKFLASALQKINKDQLPLPSASAVTASLYISNPFKTGDFLENLFSTHPPIEERIIALNKLIKST